MAGRPEKSTRDTLVEFYRQCLQTSPPVAPLSVINDSQTTKILEALFSGPASPKILDIGCGKLRLLAALCERKRESDWVYLGVDLEDPATRFPSEYQELRSLPEIRGQWRVNSTKGLRASDEKYDFAVIMNVFHEASLIGAANAIEDARQHLKESGALVLVDTVVLPEGEPRFVPYYPWEIEFLFPKSANLSYESKSGIPVSFYTLRKEQIPPFHGLPKRLSGLFFQKRDSLAQLANRLLDEKNALLRQKMGLGKDAVFDYGYVNAIVSNASVKILEYFEEENSITGNPEFLRCAIDFFHFFLDEFEHHKVISANDVYSKLSRIYSYHMIEKVLDALSQSDPPYVLIFPFFDVREPLKPTDAWDVLVDDLGLDFIEEYGLQGAILIAGETLKKRRGDV